VFVKNEEFGRIWPQVIKSSFQKPSDSDIIITATAEATLVSPAEVLDGTKLGKYWQDIVTSTHPEYGDVNKVVAPSIFMPLDLDRFLAVRVRAVSAMEKWGPNVNGDAFPEDELERSHSSLIAKGFYDEHNSFDPINAMGIIAHAQWLPEEQYVVCVALIDKLLFPEKADMVRHAFRTSKKAGVSIGCIAGSAECSICGNIAKKRNEICAHMDRSSGHCVKGRSLPDSRIAYDICRDLRFYELSFTKAPADHDALPHFVHGADIRAADIEPTPAPKAENILEEKPEPANKDIELKMPDDPMLNKYVDRAVNQAIKSRVNKLVKAEVDRVLGPYLREMQVNVKPDIKEKVEDKKEEVKEVSNLETKKV
jgi:hypothetical protein